MNSNSSSHEPTPIVNRLTPMEFIEKMSSMQSHIYSLNDVELYTKTSAELYQYPSNKQFSIENFNKFFDIQQVKNIINNNANFDIIKNLLDNHLSDKPELLTKFIDKIDNKEILSKLKNESKIFSAPRTEVNQAVFEKLTNKIQSNSCSIM
jgi:hypothetical protein